MKITGNVPLSGPGFVESNVLNGTDEGQMIYWDSANSVYKGIDINSMVWDEPDKELGIGSNLPNEPLHVQSDFDGNKGVRVQNESLGTAAVARFIVDTSGGSSFFAAYGLNYTTTGARIAGSSALVASSNSANGLSLVARNGTNGIIRFYTGGNTDADLQAYFSTTGNLKFTTTTGTLIVANLTTVQRDAIAAPENGMIIYNTDTNKFQGYENGAWVNLI